MHSKLKLLQATTSESHIPPMDFNRHHQPLPGVLEYDSEKVDLQLAVTKKALETDAAIRATKVAAKKEFVFPDVERQPGEYFPTERIRDMYVDGVRFDDLPTVYITSTLQNTKGGAYLSNGNALTYQSGGRVGFKNTKKKTAVCGQTVGFAIGLDLIKKGYKNTLVVLKGFGQGRLPCLKGLQLAGINIVSITDSTYPNVTTRPKGKRTN
ncbi:RT11-like protein [Mya arenaria]|uniref:RT11-like protein n=1 Tax=Mya arenaria TaxID=6604 RepID=A0ABY7DLA6_MYAAR|nr:RT11-like protein [Mya arenaria]